MTITKISEYERDLIDLLQEECGEAVQAGSKAIRFGWNSVNPYLRPEEQKPNFELLEDELGDILAVQQFLVATGAISAERIAARAEWKRLKLIEKGYV